MRSSIKLFSSSMLSMVWYLVDSCFMTTMLVATITISCITERLRSRNVVISGNQTGTIVVHSLLCILHLFLSAWLTHWPNGRVFVMARETVVQSQVESYQRLKKCYLITSLLNTQHYKVHFAGKVEQSRKSSSTLPYTLV